MWLPPGGWIGRTWAQVLNTENPGVIDALMDTLRAGITDTGTPGVLVSNIGNLVLKSQGDPRAWVSDVGTLKPRS